MRTLVYFGRQPILNIIVIILGAILHNVTVQLVCIGKIGLTLRYRIRIGTMKNVISMFLKIIIRTIILRCHHRLNVLKQTLMNIKYRNATMDLYFVMQNIRLLMRYNMNEIINYLYVVLCIWLFEIFKLNVLLF